jgi:UDP-N-acetyl-D-mannosaminuronic acid dehydrogenase
VLCVPTPLTADRHADLSALHAAISALLPVVQPGSLVLVESTVPVGTTEAVAARLQAVEPTVRVAHTPERVLPGDALREIVHNDRLVGGVDPASTQAAATFLATWVQGPLHPTDARTAELAKLAENAARDVQLALVHELDALAAHHGVDGWTLRSLVNRHPRVHLLRPSPGVGGPCVPVDPWFLVQGGDAPLLATARAVNDARPAAVVQRILARRPTPTATLGLLGLTYKPDVADLTGSPALQVARQLARHGEVRVHDALLEAHPSAAVDLPLPLARLERVLACDLVVCLVAHRAYVELDPPPGVVDIAGAWRSVS